MGETENMIGMNPKYLEKLKEFCLFDDTFFNTVFQDNVEAMELVLQIVLERTDIKVQSVHVQKEIRNFGGHSVRFDAAVVDGDGRPMDVEVQREDAGADVKRARFHSSVMDVNSLEKGKEYKDLPESYVIFITEHDVLGEGLPLYHIERKIEETGSSAGDGMHIIYVNGAYQDDTSPIGRLIHDFLCKEVSEMFYKPLAKSAGYFKEDKEGARKMCRIMDELMEEGIAIGEAKGKAEGIAIGKAKGKAEGQSLLNRLNSLLLSENRLADLARATEDSAFQKKLLEEYGLA